MVCLANARCCLIVFGYVSKNVFNYRIYDMAKTNKEKIEIELDNKEKALAQAPVIVSSSRSTDIPAFYCDWFFHRLKV